MQRNCQRNDERSKGKDGTHITRSNIKNQRSKTGAKFKFYFKDIISEAT